MDRVEQAARYRIWLVAAAIAISFVCLASVVISGWLIDGVERANGGLRKAAQRSALGEYFGAVSAVFSGLALLLLVVTLLFQLRELRMQRQELALQREELIASHARLHRFEPLAQPCSPARQRRRALLPALRPGRQRIAGGRFALALTCARVIPQPAPPPAPPAPHTAPPA